MNLIAVTFQCQEKNTESVTSPLNSNPMAIQKNVVIALFNNRKMSENLNFI